MPKLKDVIKEDVKKATLSKDESRRNILKVVLSEIQSMEYSKGQSGEVTDAQVVKAIQKIMKSNDETMVFGTQEMSEKLKLENKILMEYLPQAMSEEEIRTVLTPFIDDIKGAKADGPAIGLAMGKLKPLGKMIDNGVVGKVVKEFRG